MTSFAAIAALLCLIVLAGVLWPLWRASRRLFAGALVTLCIVTLALYRLVGTPAAIDAPAVQAMPTTLAEAVKRLEAELANNPNEAEGWRLLARSYLSLERPADARAAFDKALKLTPGDAELLVEAAQARMLTDPRKRLDANAVALLQRALAVNPQHQRARWFLGVSQRQQGQPAEAAKTWEPLLSQVDAGTAATLLGQINDARGEAGLPALPPPAAGTGTDTDTDTASPALLRVTVDIAPELKTRLGAGDTLFVFARQAGGPPMPVAAKRLPATGFPIAVELGDADSPMPTRKLSQVDQVELVARVSKGGDVMARPGDLESAPQPADTAKGERYRLRIERVVP